MYGLRKYFFFGFKFRVKQQQTSRESEELFNPTNWLTNIFPHAGGYFKREYFDFLVHALCYLNKHIFLKHPPARVAES